MSTNPSTNDIERISLVQLLFDYEESKADIEVCKRALSMGIIRYGGPNHNELLVEDRMIANKKIVAAVEAELKRRNVNIIDMDMMKGAKNG